MKFLKFKISQNLKFLLPNNTNNTSKFNFQILRFRLNRNYAFLNTYCVIFTFGSINYALGRFRRKDGAIMYMWTHPKKKMCMCKNLKIKIAQSYKGIFEYVKGQSETFKHFLRNVMKLLLSSMVFRTRSTICINICVGLMANWIVFLYCIVWIVESKFI